MWPDKKGALQPLREACRDRMPRCQSASPFGFATAPSLIRRNNCIYNNCICNYYFDEPQGQVRARGGCRALTAAGVPLAWRGRARNRRARMSRMKSEDAIGAKARPFTGAEYLA